MFALSTVIVGVELVRRLNPSPIDHLGGVTLTGLVGFSGNELSLSTGSASADASARQSRAIRDELRIAIATGIERTYADARTGSAN